MMSRRPRAAVPWSLAAFGVVFAVVAEREQLQAGEPWSGVIADFLGGMVFVAAGVLMWHHRPQNRIWWLLTGVGLMWFVGSFINSDNENLTVFGFGLGGWYDFFLVWLLLAYPTGRLALRRDRILLGVLAALFTARTIARLFLYVPPDGTGCECVQNRFLPVTDPRWYDGVTEGFLWAFTATFLLALASAVARWRRSSLPGRRMLAPIVVTGAAVAAELGYEYVVRRQAGVLAGFTKSELFYVIVTVRAAAAVACVLGLWRLRSTRSAVVDLVGDLGSDDSAPDRLGDALRRALGDPSLVLLPWSADADAYVDANGRRVDLPVDDPGRASTLIEQEGAPVAVLVHDEALLEDPGLVGAVVAAVRLNSDNERLRTELQSQLAEVDASRARILAAGDEERRRIERDLHDGAQQRLVTIALALRLSEARLDADADPGIRETLAQTVKDLGEAIDELRDLARGIHPAILSEAGLQAALESLVDRSPLPVRLDVNLPSEPPAPAAATAYFAVSEALTNVAKHSRATDVLVRVSARTGGLLVEVADDGIGGAASGEGSGLRGMADRVAAAGGALKVESPADGGTHLEVDLPCVWS